MCDVGKINGLVADVIFLLQVETHESQHLLVRLILGILATNETESPGRMVGWGRQEEVI
jgi:hypothetical protein